MPIPELAELYPMVAAGISGEQRPRRILAEHTWLRRRTRTAQLVHHGGGTAPVGGHRPIVLTIHDLQYLTHPEYLSASKLRYLSWSIPRSVKRATVIAVPTEYVRRTVIDAYATAPDRVVVVPHGVEPALGADAPSASELRRPYGLGTGPRARLSCDHTSPQGPSVPARGDGPTTGTIPISGWCCSAGQEPSDDEVTAMIERLELGRRVVRLGRVTDAHRDGLIALADALVFPSEYEGFGAPVVEAMALGTPVICSDQPALAEVIGDAGIVLPREAEAWADALDVLARRATELATAGRRRAESFTAERSGAGLAAAYRTALDVDR